MANQKKIKIFFKLHWVKIVVITCLVVIIVSLIALISAGLNEWGTVDAISKQRTVAFLPFQLYMSVVSGIFSAFVFGLMWLYIGRGGAARAWTQFGKSTTEGKEIGIYWNDVIGMEEVKKEAQEVVRLIKERAEFKNIDTGILKGVLLFGPPGCGKTYLVKAIATETNLPFLNLSGSEFTEIFVGVGASRVRKLFKQARDIASLEGGCIIFIDEIDALGFVRATDTGFGGQTERNTTLNQLLVEMDGLKGKSDNIVVFGATNMPERFLDLALLRPGRFDRKIYIDPPDFEDRAKIFSYYLSKINCAEDINAERLSRLTAGNTPAEIANIVREAGLIASRNSRNQIVIKDINEARERITLGIKRRIKMTKEEKMRISYHEAGHLLIAYMLVPAKEIYKATIIPRGQASGAIWISQREEFLSRDKDMLLGEIKIGFAGYMAEKIKFGKTSTGVEMDFKDVTFLAHNMAWCWGMGKSGHIGNFEPERSNPGIWAGLHGELDNDARQIIQDCLVECEETLKKNWPIADKIAAKLFEKEELEYDEINDIFKEFGKERHKPEVKA